MKKKKPAGEEGLIPGVSMDRPKKLRKKEKDAKARDRHGMGKDCAPYTADHVLGHAPRDSYEKQFTLYPEELRAEYAKASSRINIFSKVESVLNTAKDPASQDARIRELEAQVAGTSTVNAEIALLERRHRESMQKMYDAIESLKEEISSLQQHDTVKDD